MSVPKATRPESHPKATPKAIQKKFIEHTQSLIKLDPKIDELIGWENKKDTLAWLDSL